MRIVAYTYNYTTQEGGRLIFPLTDKEVDEIKYKGEIMVDSCDLVQLTGVGKNVAEFNDFVKTLNDSGVEELDLAILGQTYLPEEIVDAVVNGNGFNIIDFYAETENWSSSDPHSESDKGRVLYDGGWAAFPTTVPEELEEYMDYAMLWRDSEVNMGIRSVWHDGKMYLVYSYPY